MMSDLLLILAMPLAGTVLGASFVFFMKDQMSAVVQKALLGFASGVMVAASIWSLLIPSMEQWADMGKWQVLPAAVGFAIGIGFLLLLDHITPHLHLGSTEPEGPRVHLSRTTMLILAVTIHNFPEGMAVGVVVAGMLQGDVGISVGAAMTLSLGIAIQNIPEGAIISMPLKSEGKSKWRSFTMGALSGVVEPIGSVLVILLAALLTPTLPFMLSFAAGAMFYVVIEELIPEASQGEHSDWSTIGFAIGFLIMMTLDVVLG